MIDNHCIAPKQIPCRKLKQTQQAAQPLERCLNLCLLLLTLTSLVIGFPTVTRAGQRFPDQTLPSPQGLRLLGAAQDVRGQRTTFEAWGEEISSIGDVNGDGLDDVAIAAPRSDYVNTAPDAGGVMVVFGRRGGLEDIDLRAEDMGGFRIIGAKASDGAGRSISAAGDVNGDGLADLIVGVPYARDRAGEAYVVFGKADFGAVNLTQLQIDGQHRGYRLLDTGFGGGFAESVSGVGDVDRDGLDDIAITWVDGVAVVYGKADGRELDLVDLGSHDAASTGFKMLSATRVSSVADAGDVNGDGWPDLVVGQRERSLFRGLRPVRGAGTVSIVFGSESPREINLDALGADGFHVWTDVERSWLGAEVAAAGDVNGDGLADVLASTFLENRQGSLIADSSVYVIYGSSADHDINVADMANRGFRIDPPDVAADVGLHTMAGVGDFDGRGTSEILLGAPGLFSRFPLMGGAAYLLFPNDRHSPLVIAAAESPVLSLIGEGLDAATGYAVSPAGDFDGDGRPDLLLSAPYASAHGLVGAGVTYMVSSRMLQPPSATNYRATMRSDDCSATDKATAVGARRGAGTDMSTPDSRMWLQFCSANPDQSILARPRVTLNRFASPHARLPVGAILAGVSWQVTWNVHTGAVPSVIATVRYTDAEVDGLDEATLGIYQDEVMLGDGRYTLLPNQHLDMMKNTITVELATQIPLQLAIAGTR